jgi:hypothetical protein
MRDYVGDTGEVPSTGVISLSPDIIVRPVLDPDPGVTFGPGTENDLTLGSTVTPGQDNFVYVRVWNRGSVAATNVTASVFYTAAATLPTPDAWQPVGSVVIPSVAGGGTVMTVSPAIRWPMASVPPLGHYCFVALVGCAQDPAPNPASFMSFDSYELFIRNNNNVTWKNFDVLPAVAPVPASPGSPVGGSGMQEFEFLAPGAADSDRSFTLAVGSRLPAGSRVWLETPIALLGRGVTFTTDGAEPRTGRVEIAAHGRTALPPARFPARSRSRCRVLVQMPPQPGAYEYEVYASQLHDGFEVGRVTWRIVPRR